MNFLVDAQLPPAFVRWLTQQGHCSSTRRGSWPAQAEDTVIWDHALRTGAIVVTKDEDFAERTARDTAGTVIVWLRVGNSTNQALLQWLAPRWSEVIELLDPGNRFIEVR